MPVVPRRNFRGSCSHRLYALCVMHVSLFPNCADRLSVFFELVARAWQMQHGVSVRPVLAAGLDGCHSWSE
eukprot:3434645-Pleurochrysis_carterae.AAC.1